MGLFYHDSILLNARFARSQLLGVRLRQLLVFDLLARTFRCNVRREVLQNYLVELVPLVFLGKAEQCLLS